ncbi:MAG: hypothetical protein A2W03_00090 [Candidatus Aminicenantes bacterium RBG_16_63_16]|nr:MAG: hypothetical protein A2W03_00090 [Candidatus Aminicenantes bacterium RBG_16_63_16]
MTIKERVYLETDNSCANCGIKGKENLSIHHIDRDRTNNAYENLIVLCHNCHHRVTLEKNITQDQIAEIKKFLIYKTLTPFGINAVKLAYRKKHGEVVGMELILNHLVDMGYLKKIGWALKGGIKDESEELSVFEITDEGRLLHDRWLR